MLKRQGCGRSVWITLEETEVPMCVCTELLQDHTGDPYDVGLDEHQKALNVIRV